MSDYLVARCDSCGHVVKVTPEHGGRRAKCPQCDAIIEFPAGGAESRLRTDTELTREARAKAGKGPDSDPETPAARIMGRHTSVRLRRPPDGKKSPGSRKMALIFTLAGTAILVIIIAIVLLKKPSGETGAPPPPPAPAAKKPAPPPPPTTAPESDPRAEAIERRVAQYVKVFNQNNLTQLGEFYTANIAELTRAFGPFLEDGGIRYEGVKVEKIEFADPVVRTTLAFRRVRTYASGKEDVEEKASRVLVWSLKDDVRVISSPPEP